ncbi:MAG: sigma-70 family RNA polymerase sigma factor [Armatimonadetes bacterium]|nr:sigma-70 family RNA polymerase sigma factor [Armatimonadota bacterium]
MPNDRNDTPPEASSIAEHEFAEESIGMELSLPLKMANWDKSVEADSDHALVAKAKAGDYAAFEKLFLRHRNLVYRFAYQMTPRRDDAEDIVQEVFLRAYQNLHRYRDEAKFTTWLLRIATNFSTDKARMYTRRNNLEQQEAKGALEWMTVGNTENAEDNLDTEYKVHALRRALAALPVHHRNVLVLRDLEGREYGELAEILNCTVGGAKLRVLRARRALKERMLPLLEGYVG